MVESFEKLPKVAKILLIIFFGWLIGGIYRIVKYVQAPDDKKNIVTLIVGILAIVTGFGNIAIAICDLITEITSDRITIFAD